jgi:HD-like signal output (HDOD) protein
MSTSTGFADAPVQESRVTSLAELLDRHLGSPSLSLPVCTESATHVLQALEAEGVDSEALQGIVSRDPALVATVLREANGPEFDAIERVGSIERAAARLGRDRLAELVASIATHAQLESEDAVLTEALRHTWTRSLAVALVSQTIAERTGSEPLAGDAHLLGMLSDIGLVFLISALHMQRSPRGFRVPFTDVVEREVLDQLHQTYGIRLLDHWNCPPGMSNVLAGRPTGRNEQRLSLFLRMAQQVVSSIGFAAAGSEGQGLDDNELWEFAEALELSYVDVAALQVHAEDLEASLNAP